MDKNNRFLGFVVARDFEAFTILAGGSLVNYNARIRERVDMHKSFRVSFPHAEAANEAAAKLREQLQAHQVQSPYQKLGLTSLFKPRGKDLVWFDAWKLELAFSLLKEVCAGQEVDWDRQPLHLSKTPFQKYDPERTMMKYETAQRKLMEQEAARQERAAKRYSEKCARHEAYNLESAQSLETLLMSALNSRELLGVHKGYLVFDSSKAQEDVVFASIQLWKTLFKNPDLSSPMRLIEPFCGLDNYWFSRSKLHRGRHFELEHIFPAQASTKVYRLLQAIPVLDAEDLPFDLLNRLDDGVALRDVKHFPSGFRNYYSGDSDASYRAAKLLKALGVEPTPTPWDEESFVTRGLRDPQYSLADAEASMGLPPGTLDVCMDAD